MLERRGVCAEGSHVVVIEYDDGSFIGGETQLTLKEKERDSKDQ